MAQLIVGLTPALARALTSGERTSDTTRLRDITTQACIELKPQTERSLDTAETEPTVWFYAEAGAETQLEDLDALLRIPGVTAAYVTPDQGPP